MKTIVSIIVCFISGNILAQSDDNSDKFWTLRKQSVFAHTDSGVFSGYVNGFLEILQGSDTFQLDFQNSTCKLDVVHDPEEMYDVSYKNYSTSTSSGKTKLFYNTYSVSEQFGIEINGLKFSAGTMDGCACLYIKDMAFKYSHEGNTEFLSLYVLHPLELSTFRKMIDDKYENPGTARETEKTMIVLPGSTLVWVIRKNN